MKNLLHLVFFSTLVLWVSMLFAQKSVIHISELPESSGLEAYADADGWLIIEKNVYHPIKHHFSRSGFTILDGWPVVATGNSQRGGTYGNLDDDDALELIFNTSTKTYALKSDGSNVAGWPVNVFNSAEYGAPAYGDINGDGYDDVVVSCVQPGTQNAGRIYAFNRDGTTIAGFPIICDGGPVKTPVLADIDGDGALDIVVELRKWPDGKVAVYKGDGTMLEGWPQLLDYIPASAVAVGDITGDGFPEIVAESYYKVWAFDRFGNVLAGFPYEPGSNRVFSYSTPVLADLDGDGFREIIVGDHALSAGNGAVHVIKNDGTSMPGWPKTTSNWIYGPVAVADIDGDGQLDLAVGDQVLSAVPACKVYAWNKNGQPLPGFPITPLDAINAQIIIADLDGDGLMELLFDDNTGNNILNGYNHDGSIMDGWPLVVNSSTFFTNPMVMDINGDFKINLAFTSSPISSAQTAMYLYSSEVTFDPELAPLPILQYNVRHTGVYGETFNPVVEVKDAGKITGNIITCYPNPASDLITIVLKNEFHESIDVLNQDGIHKRTIPVNGQVRITIDISDWRSGVYLLRSTTRKGAFAHAKLIKL